MPLSIITGQELFTDKFSPSCLPLTSDVLGVLSDELLDSMIGTRGATCAATGGGTMDGTRVRAKRGSLYISLAI